MTVSRSFTTGKAGPAITRRRRGHASIAPMLLLVVLVTALPCAEAAAQAPGELVPFPPAPALAPRAPAAAKPTPRCSFGVRNPVMMEIGIWLTVIGTPTVALAGFGYADNAGRQPMAAGYVYAPLMLLGTAMALAGVPLWIVGAQEATEARTARERDYADRLVWTF